MKRNWLATQVYCWFSWADTLFYSSWKLWL